MVVPLPIGVSDPMLRLQQIAKETARRKARSGPSLGTVPHRGIAGRGLTEAPEPSTRQRVQCRHPRPGGIALLCGGAAARGVPAGAIDRKSVPRRRGMSYSGQFTVMTVADQDASPDLEVFAAGVRDDLRTLALSTRVTSRRPWTPRPSAVKSPRPRVAQRTDSRVRGLGHSASRS